jgi:hypothetical protein
MGQGWRKGGLIISRNWLSPEQKNQQQYSTLRRSRSGTPEKIFSRTGKKRQGNVRPSSFIKYI